ncbi:single-stranded-DNA-specific exonuclease RecJ [Caldimonas thermodepolymerans]|jgi:single-stranded-DNA-specific exonuclease RecJ|uniref:Single-stranded-DNA-specific exonuclease RecJ n=1 Tax=Caldimonas thermodepolymerans TaxID=215580 RepID=A0A2S5T4G7_9BURK|nr:single-stranded-DNA-specific exonuclease RecJ [Caldimonas thermodepolymerans]PPE69852.1 single-stranded-DNA-specific exonuclease RecJ [Caldimonas thermodepolymerans]QPC32687.1 single-stranded-DNA-specific exonuclease RecJ [Caldimonas thermodepolymerans]RDI03444.1 exonuclease RecJ [Caldimonas thermodepolymerans]
MKIILRECPPRAAWALEQAGVHPLLARLYAARGIASKDELDDSLARLLPPTELRGATEAARFLADAIQQGRRLCVVADYDCDGATACAVALRGLRLLGARPGTLSYVVPDRAVHGYGLSPAVVELARQQRPDVLVTVDNGIASIEGVAAARAHGLDVIITDHHLPAMVGERVVLPEANVIVNPSQPGCGFASKSLAGVGVMFYVLLAVRAELRARGAFADGAQPRLDALLDLVALGTVADVVKLDANNRRLVAQGLKRIRAGRMHAGIAALFAAARRDPARATAFDFGFALGPRINAAGRLADMTLGIECLLTDDPQRAAELAQTLDAINRERRDVEAGMREQAEAMLERLMPAGEPPAALAIFDPDFHEGVVGIVASRLKDQLHRPTFVFALGQDGLLKGSGRSIPGFHLRDALDLVSKRHPQVLKKFGGHAMAAGATLAEEHFPTFERAFQEVADEWLEPHQLHRTLATDGPLEPQWFVPEVVQVLEQQVWGQAFEAPVFSDEVEIVSQRIVGERHLKLTVRHAGMLREAIWFGRSEPLPPRALLAYRLSLDEFNGNRRVQMVVEGVAD